MSHGTVRSLAGLLAAGLLCIGTVVTTEAPAGAAGGRCDADPGTTLFWCSNFAGDSSGIPFGWSGFLNGGAAESSGGVLHLYAPNGDPQFPYLFRPGNRVPKTGSFTVVARMQFTSSEVDGDGLAFTDRHLANGVTSATSAADNVALEWSDSGGTRSQLCSSSEPVGGALDDWNLYTLEVTAKADTMFVNGVQASTCPGARRVKDVELGNAAASGTESSSWSFVSIDYLKVEKGIPTTPG